MTDSEAAAVVDRAVRYGVRSQYLGKRFRELELPVRNYCRNSERSAALAADAGEN